MRINAHAQKLSTYLLLDVNKRSSYKIDGEAFLELTEEYLREVAPILGDRIKLKKIISGVQLNSSAVGSSNLLPGKSIYVHS